MNKFFAFFLGIITALSALFFQIILTVLFPVLENSSSLEKIGPFMFLAIFIEEFFRFFFLWKISKSENNIFWHSCALGGGFATTEVFLHIWGNFPSDLNLFFSFFNLFLVHFLISAIYGHYLSKKVFLLGRLVIFLIGCSFHFIFNLFILLEINRTLLSISLIMLIFFVFLMEKKISCQNIRIKLKLN